MQEIDEEKIYSRKAHLETKVQYIVLTVLETDCTDYVKSRRTSKRTNMMSRDKEKLQKEFSII